jgi:hypothetical protein
MWQKLLSPKPVGHNFNCGWEPFRPAHAEATMTRFTDESDPGLPYSRGVHAGVSLIPASTPNSSSPRYWFVIGPCCALLPRIGIF